MTYSIDELEKAFGVNQESGPNQQPQNEELLIDKKYIYDVHSHFSSHLKKVSEELQELESKVSIKRNEFFKVQGAYELISGLKRDLDNANQKK